MIHMEQSLVGNVLSSWAIMPPMAAIRQRPNNPATAEPAKTQIRPQYQQVFLGFSSDGTAVSATMGQRDEHQRVADGGGHDGVGRQEPEVGEADEDRRRERVVGREGQRRRDQRGQTDEQHGHLRPGYTPGRLKELFGSQFVMGPSRTYSRFFSELVDTALHMWAWRSHNPRVRHLIAHYNKCVTNRLMLPFSGRSGSSAIVHHVGRRSGTPYATPVIAHQSEGDVLIPLPYGTDVDWLHNLLAAEHAVVDLEGRSLEVDEPAVVDIDDVIAAFAAVLREDGGSDLWRMERDGGEQQVLLACPEARIYRFNASSLEQVDYEETEHFQVYRSFMLNPSKYLQDN